MLARFWISPTRPLVEAERPRIVPDPDDALVNLVQPDLVVEDVIIVLAPQEVGRHLDIPGVGVLDRQGGVELPQGQGLEVQDLVGIQLDPGGRHEAHLGVQVREIRLGPGAQEVQDAMGAVGFALLVDVVKVPVFNRLRIA